MADLHEIVENPREDKDGKDLARQGSTKRKGSRKRRKSGEQEVAQSSPSGHDFQEPEKRQKEKGSGGHDGGRQPVGRKRDPLSAQEDPRARFYEDYHNEAEEYDKEFMKKYDEDLNTTLIFAGLFSAVASAFILDIQPQLQPQLQPDPGVETTALLRVLIYKIDNTTFESAPTLPPPQTLVDPPRVIVQVQAILYASLAVTLFSAFLAMLGKQWLNRYASTDMRGTAIERSQNRQRKLDGIVTWYFDHVMESLPLMLQAGLLLFGCAISRYLWEINPAVAAVIIAVTSFGGIFYSFILAAGTASESCPYQTPGTHILRQVLPRILPALRSVPSVVSKITTSIFSKFPIIAQNSCCWSLPVEWWRSLERPWYKMNNIAITLYCTLALPIAPAMDAYLLGRALLRLLFALGKKLRRRSRRNSIQTHGLDQKAITLDLRCILWMLQTSLDKVVHLSTLKHLETMTSMFTSFNPALVVSCFEVFTGCINVSNREVVIIKGSEQLATVSALCFFHTLSHLLVMDPTSSVVRDIRQRYAKIFPPNVDFRGHEFSHTMNATQSLFIRSGKYQWSDYEPPSEEYTLVSHAFLKLVQLKYQRTEPPQVPDWILHFALHSLSLDLLPPTAVIADCLSIIAVDLDCDVSNIATTALDESVRVGQVSGLITQKLKTMAEASDHSLLESKREAVSALLPYAVWQERDGNYEMLDTILRVARASRMLRFVWDCVGQYAGRLFSGASPRAVVLISSHIPWGKSTGGGDRKALLQRCAAAAFEVSYTEEEVGQSVVDTLLQIASVAELLPHIPANVWSLLTKRPALPPTCLGRHVGTWVHIVKAIRALQDTEILKSYFLLVWSEWEDLQIDGFNEMCASIREDFGGIEMGHHRTDLLHRLDHILEQLDLGLDHFRQRDPNLSAGYLRNMKRDYGELKKILLETTCEPYLMITLL